MTKEQAAEFVRVAKMSQKEVEQLNLPPVKRITRADLDRMKAELK